MPVPTNSRYEQSSSPPLTTPARPKLRTPSTSNNTSYSPTVTSGGGQSKLNVVTRVAIEGKAKKGQDGASIKMFLKMCIPLDSVTPGSTIALFPEENVKILTSQVHPLDSNSVPYNFSSTVSPLLHNAARALSLPARSSENFASAFNLAKSNGHSSSIRSSKSDNSEHVPPIDVQYTGQILVSGYNISFVLPKVFLQRRKTESDNEDEGYPRTPAGRRRPSVGERNQAHFMAAIDMWVPFMSKPTRHPYLLSIPSPRCLHNHIKLRIFPAISTSTSMASLSSMEEDSNAWDLTSDPHVTRNVTRPSRSHSVNHFADDESSDSSTTGTAEGCVIQGTFPSAERIRVRWAKPMRNFNASGEDTGRRRVGVENVKGEMTCVVRGKGRSSSNPNIEGILMDVEYKGQCKGIWHPGVATMLGLDISLEAKGSDLHWAEGQTSQWEVSGGVGYTGFDNGSATPQNTYSRASSFDSNGPGRPQESYQTARTNSASSSTASLLRAPLPVPNVAEYSFEGSNPALPTLPSSPQGTMSSMSSLTAASMPNLPPPEIRPPGSPVTLHINVNDLQPPSKSILSFTVSGTVLVVPRSTLSRVGSLNSSVGSDKPTDLEPIVLPRFTILAADHESTSMIVRNDVEGASVEVFHPTGDIYNDPQTRKTVLQRNGSTKCGEDGGRIALKDTDTFHINVSARPVSRPRTPSNGVVSRMSTNSPVPRSSVPMRARRDGPPIITSVDATITAFSPGTDLFPDGYAVRLCLKIPANVDSDWLEFGMSSNALKAEASSAASGKVHPKIVLICASVDGIPVKAEMTRASAKAHVGGASFEDISGKEWISWGKVFAGGSVGGNMVIDYLVKDEYVVVGKGKKKMADHSELHILLPTFFHPVARFEVKIDAMQGLDISFLDSEFDYVHSSPTGHRLVLCSLKEFTHPQLVLAIRKSSKKSGTTPVIWYFILTWTLLLLAFAPLYRLAAETHRLQKMVDGYSVVDSWTELPTVTATTTVYSGSSTRWWFGESETSSTPTPSAALQPTPDIVTPITTETIPHTHYDPHADNLVKETSIITMPSQSILDTYGLMPMDFSFSWTEQHTVAVKKAMAKVVRSLEFVWVICRKVYHYPLDPP